MFERDVRLESFLLRVLLDAIVTAEPRHPVALVLLVTQLVAAVLVRLHLTYGAHVSLVGDLTPGVVFVATVTVFGFCVTLLLDLVDRALLAFKLQSLKQAPRERDASL